MINNTLSSSNQELQKELEKDQNDYELWKIELNNFLSKFDNIDLLFQKAALVINKLFNNQAQYDNLDDFQTYLKEEILFFVKSFNLKRKDKKLIRERLFFIEESYHELLYFWEFDPVQTFIDKKISEEQNKISDKIDNIVKE